VYIDRSRARFYWSFTRGDRRGNCTSKRPSLRVVAPTVCGDDRLV